MLDKEKSQENDGKRIFNVTYYPVFRYLKSELKELLVILECDEEDKKVFPEVPIIGFKDRRTWNHIWWQLPSQILVSKTDASYAVEIDLLVNYSVTWKIQVLLKVNSNNVYQIKKKVNYNSKMVVYFPECSVCRKPYKSTTVTKFSARNNNCKST